MLVLVLGTGCPGATHAACLADGGHPGEVVRERRDLDQRWLAAGWDVRAPGPRAPSPVAA